MITIQIKLNSAQNSIDVLINDKSVKGALVQKLAENGFLDNVVFFDNDEDWKAYRKTGIGGTGASVIMGNSSYISEEDLYNDIKKEVSKDVEIDTESSSEDINNQIFKMLGHNNEELAAQLYAKTTGYDVIACTDIYPQAVNWIAWNPNFATALASIDRIVVDDKGRWGILEIKNSWTYTYKKWDYKKDDFEGVNPEYCYQPIHYVSISDIFEFADIALLAPLAPKKFNVWHWERDKYVIGILQEAIKTWWDKYINGDNSFVLPKLDLDISQTGTYVQADAKLANMADKLADVRLSQKTLKAEEEKIVADLRSIIPNGASLVFNHRPIIEHSISYRDNFDAKKFKLEHPAFIAEYTTQSEIHSIRIL